MIKFSKKCLAVAAGLALYGSSALAAPIMGVAFQSQKFFVNPSAPGVGEAQGQFTAGSINFDVRSLVNQAGTGFTETGSVLFSAFSTNGIGSTAVGSFTSGLGQVTAGSGNPAGYSLYALFTGTGTTSVDGAGSIQGVFNTFLTGIFVDKNNDTLFNAPGSQLPTAPTSGTLDDVNVLNGTLQVGVFNVAGALNNGSFDVVFNVTDFGTAPGFFSTTIDGVALKQGEYTGVNSQFIGIAPPPNPIVNGEIDGSGNLVFGAQAVPEPASLALVGLGLAGIGFARRKKSA